LSSSDGTSSISQKPNRKELFYDSKIGFAELVVYPRWPDRTFLNAGYYLDLSKSSNMRKTLLVVGMVFNSLKEAGYSEVYCHVNSVSSYNFNRMLGFESILEGSIEHGIELMKKVL